jgi:hypothetical protein
MSWAFCALEIVCAYLGSFMLVSLIILAIPYGLGVDFWNIYLDDVIMVLKVHSPQLSYRSSKLTPD